MSFDFSQVVNRRNNNSDKWTTYGIDTLPMWIADMDFKVPQAVQEGLERLAESGIYGYGKSRPERLLDAIIYRMKKLYGWEVERESILFLPSLVTGINIAGNMIKRDNQEASYITTTPIYPPFLAMANHFDLKLIQAPLAHEERHGVLHYYLDAALISSRVEKETELFLLCQPHNPTGRIFTKEELKGLESIASAHDLIVISDEIHGELTLAGNENLPYALLSSQTRQHTITLFSASKTFNLAGLGGGFAIIENPQLRKRYQAAMMGLVPRINVVTAKATELAFDYGDEWLFALKEYLTANRDYLIEAFKEMEGLKWSEPEATYLMWLDFRETSLGEEAHSILLKNHLALSDGVAFGAEKGFVRLNFAAPRVRLQEAVEIIKALL